MRVRILMSIVAAALSVSCAGSRAAYNDPSKWVPGQILDESSTSLGWGYKEVSRSEVNPPGHWEAVGHFRYVYFRKAPLCECSASEVAIKPGGRYAIYSADQGGALTVFDSRSMKTRKLSEAHIGYPEAVDWGASDGAIKVRLRLWDSGSREFTTSEAKLPFGADS